MGEYEADCRHTCLCSECDDFGCVYNENVVLYKHKLYAKS